ncbi:MAG: carboxypeptidase-like regulatory domain-containing protein, partial [Marinoscillum sp.]
MKKVYWKFKMLNTLGINGILAFGLLTLLSLSLSAQERIVSGQIVDSEDGSAIPGANVVVKGTLNGTTTDFDGNYKLSVADESTLVISFIGYKTIELPVGNRSLINVELVLDIEELQEVVVVGYGAVQKKDVTGVVAKVDKEDFNRGAITSPTELLAGKVAGVSITSSGGI